MKLVSADKSQIKQIKRLYKLAFPRREQKPFWLIRKKQREGSVEILAICDDDFLGLVITSLYNNFALIDYFAIDETKRGKGLGSDALRLIKERYAGKQLFLEIEVINENAPNNNERIRRKKFYLKNGFTQANIQVNVLGVAMELLTCECGITFREYQNIYVNVYGSFFKLKAFLRQGVL